MVETSLGRLVRAAPPTLIIAGLVPAILFTPPKDARDEPGHDEWWRHHSGVVACRAPTLIIAGLVPAILFARPQKDARDEPGHDECWRRHSGVLCVPRPYTHHRRACP